MKSAKFKDSPLGPIPQDWEVKRLGEIGEPLMCKRVLKHQTSDQGDIPFYKIGTFGKTPDAYITRSLFESLRSKYPFPRKGDCLISAAGTIGRVVVYNGEDAYFQDSNIVWIDNDESVVTNEYLALCYALMKWQSEDGGIISRLYNANLKAQIIVCPPLPGQQRIAEALGEVDKLIESLDEQIEKKHLIARGVAHDLLGMRNDKNEPIRRIPGFKGEWEKKDYKDVILHHKWKSIGTSEYESSGQFPVIDQGQEAVVAYSDNIDALFHVPDGGAIVFGDHTRIVKYVSKDFIVGADGTQILSGLGCDTQFLYHALRQIEIPNLGYNRHFKFIKNHQYSLPPTLAEQQAIADLLSEQDAAIAVLEAKRENYVRIKEGMMRDLLTGRVRMGFAASDEVQSSAKGEGRGCDRTCKNGCGL